MNGIKENIPQKLSDHLMEILDDVFEEYNFKYQKMADLKRYEDSTRRQKDQELQKYKNEKKRPIPSWPEKILYSKFKPDLLSWNSENYLSSESAKFGQMLEMLKKEGRITTFEQVQTRLGRQRDEKNIIVKVVELLDTINEETCFNKLSKAWDSIISLKRGPSESLNNFFSRYETLQYSLNCADDSYKEPSASDPADVKELMATRKIELNDKLKSIVLLKSIGIDESHTRDVLAKIDFNKEPSSVYEATRHL